MTSGPDDRSLLGEFENGLVPTNLAASRIPAKLLGYGEISAIFQIGDDSRFAWKRLPLFRDRPAAEAYAAMIREYCDLLTEAGLRIPEYELCVVDPRGRVVTLYIRQHRLPSERFAHKLVGSADRNAFASLLETIVGRIGRLWEFGTARAPALEIALDGQLSNWVLVDGDVFYVDTSTPLYRKNGVEQIDPELFLRSAPSFLRWIIRWLFLKDVMSRYYDKRQVLLDLAANLHKEQRPDLLPMAVDAVNAALGRDHKPLTLDEVNAYYRQDKRIWTVFLAFRRIDRWLQTKLLRRRYEFILPGRIKR